MSGTTISSKTTVAVRLTSASQIPLVVTATGEIDGGSGFAVEVVKGLVASLSNLGTIVNEATTSAAGVELLGSASIVNGATGNTSASIGGYRYGVDIGTSGSGSITNFGTIAGTGTQFSSGVFAINLNHRITTIVNGSTADTAARIAGVTSGVAEYGAGLNLTNFGAIVASQTFTPTFVGAGTGVIGWGVSTIVNGAAGDTAASISGYFFGLTLQGPKSSVTNYGTIAARDLYTFQDSTPTSQAVVLHDGGSIVNGNSADAAATLIGAGIGVDVGQRAGFVSNFGTILGTDIYYGEGVVLAAGGSVTNGGTADSAALIEGVGSFGVDLAGARPSAVINYGTIAAPADAAIELQGGAVVNGAAAGSKALISGEAGIYALAPISVTNFGTIRASGTAGVTLLAGGAVANDGGAIVGGGTGAGIAVYSGAASITNTGSIGGQTGILFERGIAFQASGTVVNAGTIGNVAGTAGVAVRFGQGVERFVDVPGSVIVGKVVGGLGSNVLELAGGATAGTIAGIGGNFSNFGTLVVDQAASWTIAGNDSIGTLTDNGILTVAGSLDLTISLAPDSGGTLALGATATLEVASVLGSGPAIQFLGGDTLTVDNAAKFGTGVGALAYKGPLLEDFSASATVDLKGIAPSGLMLSYATATGLLTISNGGGPVASLLFQNSSLGAGGFHSGPDAGTGTFLTHS